MYAPIIIRIEKDLTQLLQK